MVFGLASWHHGTPEGWVTKHPRNKRSLLISILGRSSCPPRCAADGAVRSAAETGAKKRPPAATWAKESPGSGQKTMTRANFEGKHH